MATLLITKETGGYFSFVVDGNTAEKVTNMRNDVFAIGNILHFKTATGANIIKTQNINVTDITLIASGSFTFTTVPLFLAKLIDVGYYDWLSGGGSGTGVDRFNELLDTFDYFGKAGQVVIVAQNELGLETVVLNNVSKFTELEDTPTTIIANKMLVGSADATKIEWKEVPTSQEPLLNAVGTFHYADDGASLPVIANVPLKLTNNAQGEYGNITNAPYGVTSVWNSIDNDFNFNELSVGDILHLRTDLNVTTNSANQNISTYIKFGIGSTKEFDITICQELIKTSGLHHIVSEISFDLGYQEIVDYPAEIYFTSDANATVKVNGWYVEIIRKNINIVDIVAELGYIPEDVDNKQNNLIPDGQGVKYPTVDAVNAGLKVSIETGSTITTVPFGGIPAGTNIQNRTYESLFIDAMIVFLPPTFPSFTISQSQLIEVGVALAGNKTFNWTTTNPANIVANSLIITDATSNTVIGSSLANDGTEVLDIGTITNTSPITRNWNIKGTDLESNVFTSNNYMVNSIYPIFFYVSNTPPIANQALIDSGIKQVVQSDGTLNITFGAVGQYLWFAHPASMPTKTKWYVNALNNGNIGTISDLFNAPTTVNVTTVLWNGIAYKVYISNTPTTTVGNMELKNS